MRETIDEIINDNLDEIFIFFIMLIVFYLNNKNYLAEKSDKFFNRASICPSFVFIIEENSSF